MEVSQIAPNWSREEDDRSMQNILYSYIASKREELSKCNKEEMDEAPFDLLTALITKERGRVQDDKFLRDGAFNFFVAGRETMSSALTWFFWLISNHPLVEAKILQEIKHNFRTDEKEKDHHNVDEEQDVKQSLSGEVLGMEKVKKLHGL